MDAPDQIDTVEYSERTPHFEAAYISPLAHFLTELVEFLWVGKAGFSLLFCLKSQNFRELSSILFAFEHFYESA